MVVHLGVLRASKMYLLMLGDLQLMVGMERGALHFIARSPIPGGRFRNVITDSPWSVLW